jgi:hypothetical protein
MRADRWNAGAALMQVQSPEAWCALLDASKLTTANSVVIGACQAAATKAKKEQHCAVVVPTPRCHYTVGGLPQTFTTSRSQDEGNTRIDYL